MRLTFAARAFPPFSPRSPSRRATAAAFFFVFAMLYSWHHPSPVKSRLWQEPIDRRPPGLHVDNALPGCSPLWRKADRQQASDFPRSGLGNTPIAQKRLPVQFDLLEEWVSTPAAQGVLVLKPSDQTIEAGHP